MLAELEAEYDHFKNEYEFHTNGAIGSAKNMAKVQKAIASLAALEGETPEFKGKMSYAIRAILAMNDRALLTSEVRHGLAVIGYDLTRHENVMATIGAVLKRLVDSREAELVDQHDGSMRYRRAHALLVDHARIEKWLAGDSTGPSALKIALQRKTALTSSLSQPSAEPPSTISLAASVSAGATVSGTLADAPEALRIQDTVNASLEAANIVVAQSKAARNRATHAAIASTTQVFPPSLQRDKK